MATYYKQNMWIIVSLTITHTVTLLSAGLSTTHISHMRIYTVDKLID